MTAKEIFRRMKVEAYKGFAYYVGFVSRRKYNAIVDNVEKFKNDAIVDRDLDVITEAEYQKEIEAYDIMLKALETAEF